MKNDAEKIDDTQSDEMTQSNDVKYLEGEIESNLKMDER